MKYYPLLVGITLINSFVLLWLWTRPMPPKELRLRQEQLPQLAADAGEQPDDDLQERVGRQALDRILSSRVELAAANKGLSVDDFLPSQSLREQALQDPKAMQRLITVYADSLEQLGEKLDADPTNSLENEEDP